MPMPARTIGVEKEDENVRDENVAVGLGCDVGGGALRGTMPSNWRDIKTQSGKGRRAVLVELTYVGDNGGKKGKGKRLIRNEGRPKKEELLSGAYSEPICFRFV